MKKIMALSLIMISIIIFNASTRLVEAEIIRSFSSFENYGDSASYVFIDGNNDKIKEILKELSINNKVNIQISTQEIIENREVTTVYWQIIDEKYIEDLNFLNKQITLEEFSQLESPINNYDNSNEYYLEMPSENYYYNVVPFNQLNEIRNPLLLLFSESEENINRFIEGLEINGLFPHQEGLRTEKIPFYQIYLTSAYKSPGLMLATSIIFLLFFILLYEDRRTMSIYLINGKSKYKYAINFSKNILKKLLIIFSAVFFIMLFWNLGNYYKHISLLLKHYMLWTSFYVILLMLMPVIISYSFTEVDRTSYKLGRKKNSLSIRLISAYKLVISVMLIINLGNIVLDLTDGLETYKNLKLIQQDSYDMHQIDYNSSSLQINSNHEIVDNLKGLENIIYVKYQINEKESYKSKLTSRDKVVFANSNYLKLYEMSEEDLLNDVFVSEKLFEKINNDINILCKEYSVCEVEEDKIKVLEEDLIMIMDYSGSNIDLIKKNYVIVKEEMKSNARLSNIFIHANEKKSNEILKELSTENDSNYYLINLYDIISSHFRFSKMTLQENIKWISTYLMIFTVYTLLFYQITFDRYRKENSILFISGENPYSNLIKNFSFQLIINAIIVMILKKIKYPFETNGIFVFIYSLTVIIEVIALMVALVKIRKNLVYNLKERI